ncbi:hypothetical protein ACWC0C_47300 [Streptomyces sp. NPDC001709]
MLHGAARLEAGLELTDLESRLVGALEEALSEDEVREFGRVYREEASVANSGRLFPDSLVARPVSEGYATEDLAKDLEVLGEETVAQDNVRVIDLDDPAFRRPGGGVEPEGFVRALSEHGYGATVVTASQTRATTSGRPLPVRLKPTKFYCERESTELTPDDEIYWCLSAGADNGSKQSSRTRTYENVDKGETHRIDKGTVLFDGEVRQFLLCNIICWEEDHGNTSDLANLVRSIARMLAEAAQVLEDADGLLPHFVKVAAGASSLIADFIAMANDDLVKEQTFLFDRAALERWATLPYREQMFPFVGGRHPEGWGYEGEYWLYIHSEPVESITTGPKPISAGWRGLQGTTYTGYIDAACSLPGAPQLLYMFARDKFVLYNERDEAILRDGKIADWPGLAGTDFARGIDTACRVPWSPTDLYLFRGDTYLRYRFAWGIQPQGIEGGPSKLAAGWTSLHGTDFARGIDTACEVPGSSTDVYLFRGTRYLRYNAEKEKITNGPMEIASGWPGLANTAYTTGVDEGLPVPGSLNEVWLFKGDRYVRYSI